MTDKDRTHEWPDIAGRIQDKVHYLPIRVYYEDTDFSSAVYHANYLKFCERGRSDCLRILNIHHHELRDGVHWQETAGYMGFVVRHMECDFLGPAQIDDLLSVETRFAEARGARLLLDQKVLRDDAVLFQAIVTVAIVTADGKPVRLPKQLLSKLEEMI